MAAPWLAVVLKSVPWVEVIRRAPDIADGARKFWQAVSGKPVQVPPIYDVPYDELKSDEDKDARIQALEGRVEELHRQMFESSQLIKNLADQNALLVAKIEDNRRRVARLSRIVLVLTVAAVALAFWLWRVQ
ncbi:hypothetical protein LG198_13285 [Methylobacillus arboreus]|uniref:hypothetical protein n=1 Tax=Methylobacillus arboreus TaxID=755170 RepID=UPI001E3625F5|nr:hypothetical protein [Methylobacillus arboreus]MCB5191706.1 hypothetical protein [Methylobacillus arboreus]